MTATPARRDASPQVAVIVVTYRSEAEITTCLASIRAAAREVSLETVVVDNASDDGTVGVVRSSYPEVTVWTNSRNRGFASACNTGIELTSAPFVLLLNPDAGLKPGTLDTLTGYLRTHPTVGIVGPALEGPRGGLHPDPSATGLFPSFRQALFEYTRLGRWFPASRWVRDYQLTDLDRRAVGRVAMVQGACFLVRRALLQDIGGFDERFFLYFEETDLCKRAAGQGWETHYLGTVAATHAGARSSADHRPLAREFVRSLYLFHRKYYGWCEALALWAILAPYHVLKTARLSIHAWRHPHDKGLQSDLQIVVRRCVAHLQILSAGP